MQFKTEKARRRTNLFRDIHAIKNKRKTTRTNDKNTKSKKNQSKQKPQIKEGIAPKDSTHSKMAKAFSKTGMSMQDALSKRLKSLKSNKDNVKVQRKSAPKTNPRDVNAHTKIQEIEKKRQEKEQKRKRRESKLQAFEAMRKRSLDRKRNPQFAKKEDANEVLQNTILAQRFLLKGDDSDSSSSSDSGISDLSDFEETTPKPKKTIVKPKVKISNNTNTRRQSVADIKQRMKNDTKRNALFGQLRKPNQDKKLKKVTAPKKAAKNTTKQNTNDIFGVLEKMRLQNNNNSDDSSSNSGSDWSDSDS
ncbi:MAG: hypothetical protein HRT87_12040 [Legionellales bacterium]|nr:hypothetical protein [Legionellales bacterium]